MLFFNPVKKFFKAMRSDATPNQLAMGIVLGMFLGLNPVGSGAWILALVVLLLVNVSLTFGIISALVFGGLAAIGLNSISWHFGYMIIEQWGSDGVGQASGPIGAFVTLVGESPALAWLRLHYWLEMGAFALCVILAVPLYFGAIRFVQWLRIKLLLLAKTKGFNFVRKSFFLRWGLWFVIGDVLVAGVQAGKAGDAMQKKEDAKDKQAKEKQAALDMAAREAALQEKAAGDAGDTAAAPAAATPDTPADTAAASTATATDGESGGPVIDEYATEEAALEKAAGSDDPFTVIVEEEVTDKKGKKKKQFRFKKPKKVPRLRRPILALTIILVVVPGIAIAVALIYINQIVEAIIEGPVAAQVGMPIDVGSVETDLGAGTITLHDVSVGPAPFEGGDAANKDEIDPKGPVFYAKALTGGITPDELARLRVHLTLVAQEPTLTLVRMPDGSMNYGGGVGEKGALPGPDAADAQPLLDENGNQVIDPETGQPMWINPHTGERMIAEEQPTNIEPEPEEYDPNESSTFDELRRFIDEMIERYEGDPDKAMEDYQKFRELLNKYGPGAAKAAEDGEEVTEESLAADYAGMASYVKMPFNVPAPGKPRFWLKQLTMQDVSVRYVDLRAEAADATIKQEHYTFDLRNISTNRMLLEEPLVVVLGRGLAVQAAENLAGHALDNPHLFGNAVQVLKQHKDNPLDFPDPTCLLNCVVVRFDETIELNEIVDLIRGKGDEEPVFRGGHIAIHTAHPDFIGQDWRAMGEAWTWVGDVKAGDDGMIPITVDDDGNTRVHGGEITIYGGRCEGVVILSLEDVQFNRGALNMPDVLFDVIEMFLGRDFESSWRFVLKISGRFVGPTIRLLNEREVTIKLRTIAVKAVQKLANKAIGAVLEQVLSDRLGKFTEKYGATPETFIVWEAGTPECDEAAAAWQKAMGVESPFRNVVTPLLFVGNKEIFLNNLGYNAVQVTRRVVVDLFDEKAREILRVLLQALPLPSEDSLPEGVTRESLADTLISGVAESLVPDFVIDAEGKVTFEGDAAYSARSQAAVDRLRTNCGTVATIVLQAWVDAALNEATKAVEEVIRQIPRDALPSDFSNDEIRELLLTDINKALRPTVNIDESFNVSVDFDQDEASKQMRNQLTANTHLVLTRLTDGYVNDASTAIINIVGERGFTADELREKLRTDVATKMFPSRTNAQGETVFRFDARAGSTQLAANVAQVLPEIGEPLVNALTDPMVQAFDRALPSGLPGSFSAESIRARLIEGVLQAWFPPDCVRTNAQGKVTIRPDDAAAKRVAEDNFKSVARDIGTELVDNIVGGAAEKVAELFPKMPGNMTPAEVRTQLSDGVGEAVVTGESPDDLAFNLQAGGQQVSRNAVSLSRTLADYTVQDAVEPVATQLAASVETMPEGYTADQMKVDLADGVGEAVIEGDTLDTIRINLAKGASKIELNAITVGRKVAGLLLEATAFRIIKPLATPLGATDDQCRVAAQEATEGVTEVWFPDGSVTVDEEYKTTVKGNAPEAKRKLNSNARVAAANLCTKLLQLYISNTCKNGFMVLLLPEEKTDEQWNDAYWEAIGKRIVPDNAGRRYVEAPNIQMKQAVQNEMMMLAQPAFMDVAADMLVFRAQKLLERNNVKLDPPVRGSDMTAQERQDFRNARNANEALVVIKKFLKRQDRVVDAVGAAMGLKPNIPGWMPQAQKQRAMEEWRNGIRRSMDGWR